MDRALQPCPGCRGGQFYLTTTSANTAAAGMGTGPTPGDDVHMTLVSSTGAHVDGIDVNEHHQIDYEVLRERGVEVGIVRAGRGTRQDARWIEHVRDSTAQEIATGSYWQVWPSHTNAHHQAELWVSAILAAPWPFAAGHWADVSRSEGFDPYELGRYVASFLRRADELLGRQVGLFSSNAFWARHVRFAVGQRRRWSCQIEGGIRPADLDDADVVATRIRSSDRGGPGWHRIRPRALDAISTSARSAPSLAHRRADESVDAWRDRWMRGADVVEVQRALNELGADLFIDGVYGPATEAAVQTWHRLRRRDGFAERSVVAMAGVVDLDVDGCTDSTGGFSLRSPARTATR